MRLYIAGVLLMLLVASAGAADAEEWEITAFGGYRWGGELSDGSFNDETVNVRDLQFDDGSCWGLTAGYRITTRFVIEALFGRQYTSFKFVNESLGADTSLGDGNVDYLMAGLSVDLLPPDYKLMPYFTFYLGAAHIVPDDADSNWFTAAGYAVGARYYFTEHLGVMLENRGTSTVVTNDASLFCADDESEEERCIALPRDTWMWQIGLSAGVVIAF